MAKEKAKVYANENSKRAVTIELRGYNSAGQYEGGPEEETNLIYVKNVTEAEVRAVIEKALEETFGKPT